LGADENAIWIVDAHGYGKRFIVRSDDAVIRVYDSAGNVIETHEPNGDFKEP
jgi:myo-inositol-hexaphosphate 3-phosphohydrolase